MRGLVLFLPVLLVLFLAGTARTEEKSSLVVDADLPSNLLPAGEKVAVREAREAGKRNGGNVEETEKKREKIRKRNERKKIRQENRQSRPKGTKNDSNKINKGKADRKKKARKSQTETKGKKGKKKKKKDRKRKRQRKNKKKESQDKKKKKKKLNKMKKKRKNKNKNGESTGRQAAGGDWSSCGTTGVNDTCLINAVNALNFEKGQIQNFFKRKARLQNHAKVAGNKKGKKGEFEEAAGYMLTAIGGNISSPSCQESQRGADSAVETYNILINCSATIHEACDMPNGTINETFLASCANIYNLSKTASDDCRSNAAYASDGAAACNCWEKAAIGIKIAKEEGCTTYGQKTAKAVTAQKKKCVTAFSKCKSAEDSAVALIHTCMSGEVNTNASSAEKELTGRLWV